MRSISRALLVCCLLLVAPLLGCSTFGGGGSARCGSAAAPLNGPDWTPKGATFTPDGKPDACGQMSSGTLHFAGPMPASGKMEGGLEKVISGQPVGANYMFEADVVPTGGCAIVNVTADGGQGAPVVATNSGTHYSARAYVQKTSLALAFSVIAKTVPCDVHISNVTIRAPGDPGTPGTPPPVTPAAGL